MLPVGRFTLLENHKEVNTKKRGTEGEKSPVPAISLPKSGGAIRGIGEKFGVNPVTGTASLSVPIVATPGRSNFGPQLSLSYNSGAGNGPFGFGWDLSLPSITRKTDKGLPRYLDADESDVFILSGAEDLVPVLDATGKRISFPRVLHGITYSVRLYQPRIEGLFARIERWTNDATGISHWRTITRDNVITLLGFGKNSTVADQADARKAFSYLIDRVIDNKGNVTVYDYVPEDSRGIDLSAAHEANRPDTARKTQRYLKYINYGNAQPYFPDWSAAGAEPPLPADWRFKIIVDYGDHKADTPSLLPDRPWPVRPDPFSRYRSGFEVRTYRRCYRVLLFHNFPGEKTAGPDYLVRSTDFRFSDDINPADPHSPIYTFLCSVSQKGYRSAPDVPDQRSLPPLEFFYSEPKIHPEVLTLTDGDSREDMPEGIDGSRFRWVDLNGEGLSGILTEQDGAWGYKRNLSPTNTVLEDGVPAARAKFGPPELVPTLPTGARLDRGQQLMDLTGEGRPELVSFDQPLPGFFERTREEGWEPFKSFAKLPVLNWSDPNLQFVDLTGDGLSDILIAGDDLFTFYPSLGVDGFGPAQQVIPPPNEERGPHVIFADGTQTVSLADMCGHGLRDLVRVRDGEICYWPNLGYGRFGRKVTMDGSPRFADQERFDPRRIRLADIDGSGSTDLLYVGDDGVYASFNCSGNSWAAPVRIAVFPGSDNLSSVQALDLLGNGTACLVWSSPLPSQSYRPIRYVDLMGSQKPHLLLGTRNNLGAETRISYSPSTRFYLEDKFAGRPWITRLPFPVQCVDRVETYDWVGRSRFVTRYAYHHGYFDGDEREFRGFGMAEQWDTEEYRDDTLFPNVNTVNESDASFNPPVRTQTWFHTGAFVEAGIVSKQYAHEYWVEPAMRGDSAAAVSARSALLLPDSFLDPNLTGEEMREAYRALKGSPLRVEVYAEDKSPSAANPYSVTEHNYTVQRLQSFGPNFHAVYLTSARETLSLHYERQVDDPRVTHEFTLEVDDFGNPRRSVSVAYPRRTGYAEPEPKLSTTFRTMLAHDQTRLHIGATEHRFTAPVNRPTDTTTFDVYRAPLPSETVTAELTGIAPATPGALFKFIEMDGYTRLPGEVPIPGFTSLWDGTHDIPYEEVSTPDIEGIGAPIAFARRIVERSHTLYRSDDLSSLLPSGIAQSMALPGESYRLAFTTSLITRVFGSLVTDAILQEGGFVRLPGQNDWWIPSGRVFFSPSDADTPVQELTEARAHFYMVRRAVDPFGGVDRRTFDSHDLLSISAIDAVGNITTADNNYRVMRSFRATDPNLNTHEVAFDCLGQVTGTAVHGKAGEGDSLFGFKPDLTDAQIQAIRTNPLANPDGILGSATSRIAYDLFAYFRTRNLPSPDAPMLYTLTRETHVSDLAIGQTTNFQHAFIYWDGFGRDAQHKVRAESGPVPGVGDNVDPRWVGSGWIIYNNKGKPVRHYEPFFSTTHSFEFNRLAGVSSVLFYDPTERLVGTLHPDNTFEKTVFDAWFEAAWDPNDTALISDPRADADVGNFFSRLLGAAPGAFTSWHDLRIGGNFGATADEKAANKDAAQKVEAHAWTPTVSHFDSLGRACLSVADNGVVSGVPQRYPTRTAMDTENKPLVIFDALGRHVMEMCLRETMPGGGGFRFVAGYSVSGSPLYRNGMDGGERRTLENVVGNIIRHWDARNFTFRTLYDVLHRPTHRFASRSGFGEILTERLIYGEKHPDATLNLKGNLFRQYDSAGLASHNRYDFKDNAIETGRQLSILAPPSQPSSYYSTTTDWSPITNISDSPSLDIAGLDAIAAPLLVSQDKFISLTRFDALNRPIQVVLPHTAARRPSVIQTTYNEANLLEKIDVWVRRAAPPAVLLDPATANLHAVTNVDYNAHGQRLEFDLGNGSTTTYTYEKETFRLSTLATMRGDPNVDARTVQALSYTYDPKGNVTRLRDEADLHTVVFFRNQRIDPIANYSYDAIYRLTSATGREHLGLTGANLNASVQPTNDDSPRMNSAPGVRLLNPGDGKAMGKYTELYSYDPVGNLLRMVHQVASGGWIRSYSYQEDSQITPTEFSNRLSATSLPGDNPLGPFTAVYSYDEHGNMVKMPHLPAMTWDESDRLQSTTRQVKNAGMPETTFYSYDADGQRVRKLTASPSASGVSPTREKELIYLGGIEIYREFDANGQVIALERETLVALLDHRRIVLVETRTIGNDPAPAQLIRYQYSNHLGSALLELDDDSAVISYEEYFPYGSTAYQAVRNQTDTPKRYRYTGKERDAENDLDYHGARYCAPWLGKWMSCDPAFPSDGLNPYVYARCNPICYFDPDGLLSIKTYDDWLAKQIASETTALTGQKQALRTMETNKTDDQNKIAADQAQVSALENKRSQVMAQRKTLESKKTKLTTAEAAKLKSLKKENTKLVKEISSLKLDISKLKEDLTRLDTQIKHQQSAIARTDAHLKDLTNLKNTLDQKYQSVSTKQGKANTELLADIVMNEARDSSSKAKEAVAYAYVNRHGGRVEAPKNKSEISHFHAGVTEKRFQTRFDPNANKSVATTNDEKEQYVKQITESLGAVDTRLDDLANKNDPTQGATHWISPRYLSSTPSWTQSMTAVTVPGVPARDFTFYKK
jgi:RHS repeat-associated protein